MNLLKNRLKMIVQENILQKKNILIPKRIGGRVLYKETDVLSRLDDARDLYYNDIIVM